MSTSELGTATPRLLLDAREYAQRVLLQGADMPWEPTAHARLLAQVRALLRPDLTLVDLSAFLAAELEVRSAVRERIAGARRATAALRSVLADDDLASDAVALVRVAGAMSAVPLAVQVPSPAAWLAALAPDTRDPAFDADDAENASVYLADWLRRLSGVPVDTLVLDGRESPWEETLAEYGPLGGLADHYRWILALRRSDALELATGTGGVLDPSFWTGADIDVPRGVAVVVSRVHPEAEPETVLDARTRWV